MSTISIIGAAGFVGTRLTESLMLAGKTPVRAIVRAYRNFASLARFGAPLAIELANAEDVASLKRAIRGSSTVVNLTTGSPAGIARTTEAIFNACVAAGVPRLVHLSSAVVYGEVHSPEIDDDSPPDTRHWMPYARAKARAEIWLREQCARRPLEVAVLRPGIVWGVRSPHTVAFVNALLNKSAYLVDGGHGVFNSIYVDNLVAFITACHEHPSAVAGFYNVADRESLTWRDFFSAFAPHLDCDVNKLPVVAGDRFPWSLASAVDYVRSLPIMSSLYHRLKASLSEAAKLRLKGVLAGPYDYDAAAKDYSTQPRVDREVWSLQRVRHKLPTKKFERHFQFKAPIPFREGCRRTLCWLSALGYTTAQPETART